MAAHESARSFLRGATSDLHRRVDEIFSAFVLAERASYGRFLCAQAAAYIPVEDALDESGIVRIVEDWPSRRRNARLALDLNVLKIKVPPPVGSLNLTSEAAMFGALYVLEGSRLGGTLLKRSVPPDFPTNFLGEVNSLAWRSLLELLDTRVRTAEQRDAAAEAARKAFALFERSGALHSACANEIT